MKRVVLAAAVAASLVAAVVGGVGARSEPDTAHASGPYDWTAVDAYLESVTGGVAQPAGASLLILDGGTPVHTASSGSGAAADPSSEITLFSVSKWIAATVVMTLVEDGEFALDDAVPDLLPDTYLLDPRWDDVTVRMLLSHTSGLAPQLGVAGICTGLYSVTLESCVATLALEPLAFPPGTAFQYTGIGYQFLGLIAEEATGDSWYDLVDARLLTPCGMDSMYYEGAQNPWVAGGVVSDLVDLGTFIELQRTGSCGATPILGSTTLADMRTAQTAGTLTVFSPYLDGRSYGLGLFRSDSTGSTNLDLYSHAGAGGTYPWTDVDAGYSAILFIDGNQYTGASTGIRLHNGVLPLIEAQLL